MPRLFLIVLLGLLLPAAVHAADPEIRLKEGAWNVTLQIDPPQSDFLPIVQMLCITKNDPVPVPSEKGGCRLLTKELLGDTVFWVAECRDGAVVTRSVGNATYDNTKVDGGVQTMTSAPGKATELRTYHLSGKRQGACR